MKKVLDFQSYAAGLLEGVRIMTELIARTVTCKHCGSPKVVKNGLLRHKTQYYTCRACGKSFVDNGALPGQQTSPQQIGSALLAFYQGESLADIQRQLDQDYGVRHSDSTIYGWITKYTKEAVKREQEIHPHVGDVWASDETVLKIEGKNIWFWDVIDVKTRYLIASRISTTRTTRDAQALMEAAEEKAGKKPKRVITDQLAAYRDGIERAYGSETEHVAAKTLTSEVEKEFIERFHGTLKERTKCMRGLKSRKSAALVTDGWLVFYNEMRPHESLDNRTPAEAAEVAEYPFKTWRDVASYKPPQIQSKPVLPDTRPKLSFSGRPRISAPLPIPHSDIKRIVHNISRGGFRR